MKTNISDRWQVAGGRTMPSAGRISRPATRFNASTLQRFNAFTLIELLVVISIMGILAAFTIPVLKKIKESQYKKVAGAELAQIESALEQYKAKYGTYPPSNGYGDALLPQLYYELCGTTNDGNYFITLDGASSIQTSPVNDVKNAYDVDGFVNCTHGSGEDGVVAQNFLPGLKPNDYSMDVTNYHNNATVRTTALVTSVRGPDPTYTPLQKPGLNPIRYVFPGTNNPNSYDLWVQLVMSGRTNLICNWSKQTIINSPLP